MGLPRDTMLFGFVEKLTQEQRGYVDSIFDKQVTIVNAKAGSGKTTLAVACADLLNKPLVYIFAPVEEGKMGFRPGTQRNKEAEYYQPLIDALYEIGENPSKVIYDVENIEAQKRGDVWVYPRSHIFARGTNIKDSTVIIAEAQNFTRGELKKVLTRIHDSCTVIIEGHDGQNDLSNPNKSGFVPYIEYLAPYDFVNVVQLTKNFRGRLSTIADEMTW
ncbi:PhoH family protein [Lysinibacillus xylanilyticus]|uniref:PhoH family protein n=1 Tax=Lysinibacillus xylanilyticus TaxID=582475 RepID=A0ABT4EMC0_9BACI|nr:PhoH family protein [Lysinibacillus xylanilyticus]MCY9546807.1 PhoH family protein [Lysinibacillus xylanilyticus]